jgi:peptide/nickel transport system permease protein
MDQANNLKKALAQSRPQWQLKLKELGQELWRDKAGFIGVVLIVSLVLMAVFAPFISPHDPTDQDLNARLAPPFWYA